MQVETCEVGKLPQTIADRFGWENMVATVARAHRALPSEERERACILTGNYGEAGAVDFYGPKYGLPKAISGHNSYYIWGPGNCTGEVVISVGVSPETLGSVFGQVERVQKVRCRYCMPDEDGLSVYVCRDPKLPFEETWPRFEHYN